MRYVFYFEFFGKKMKTTIKATSKQEAESMLRSKINVLKVDEVKEWNDNTIFDFFNNLTK